MGIYIGVDGKVRKVRGAYLGMDGKARRIAKAYIGDENGKARLVWASGIFISSFAQLYDQNGAVSQEQFDARKGDYTFSDSIFYLKYDRYSFGYIASKMMEKRPDTIINSDYAGLSCTVNVGVQAECFYASGGVAEKFKLKEIVYTDNGVEKTAADWGFIMTLTDDGKNYINPVYWAPWAET